LRFPRRLNEPSLRTLPVNYADHSPPPRQPPQTPPYRPS
jgi:hypothetical protein